MGGVPQSVQQREPGRRVNIETLSSAEDWKVASQAPLLAIDYDPVGKGDDVVISLGRDSLAASHVVPAPQELWEAQDENGKVVAVQIVDKAGGKTLLSFESGRPAPRCRPPAATPVGVAAFAEDVAIRRYGEQAHNIVRWSDFTRGGHFAALEAPELLVGDVRAFFAKLR